MNFWYTVKKCCRISKSWSTEVEDSTLLHKGRLNLRDWYQLGSFWSWKPSKVLRNRGKAFRRQWFTSSQWIFTVHMGINVALISTMKKNVNLNPLLFTKNKTKQEHHTTAAATATAACQLGGYQLKCSRSVAVSGLEHKKRFVFFCFREKLWKWRKIYQSVLSALVADVESWQRRDTQEPFCHYFSATVE